MPIRRGDGTEISPSGIQEVRLGDGTVLWSSDEPLPDYGATVTHQWTMSEGSGGTLTDSVGGSNATIEGATWDTSTQDWYGGAALSGDGSSAYVDTGQHENEQQSTAVALTFVHPHSSSANGVENLATSGFESGGDTPWEIRLNGSNLEFNMWDGANSQAYSLSEPLSSLPAGRPHRVVAQYGDGTMELWVNGTLADSMSAPISDLTANTQRLLFAHDDGGTISGYFPGQIDNVLIFDGMLPESGVQTDLDEQPWEVYDPDATIVSAYRGVDWQSADAHKVNLHTHSISHNNTSEDPEYVYSKYADAGFEALAITEHDYQHHTTRYSENHNTSGVVPIEGMELEGGPEDRHVLSLFNDLSDSGTWDHEEIYQQVGDNGGLVIIPHPTRYEDPTEGGFYSEYFTDSAYNHVAGIEIWNDNRLTNGPDLYDNLLTEIAPDAQVYCFGGDDYHGEGQGYSFDNSYNLVVSDTVTEQSVRDAIESGHVLAVRGGGTPPTLTDVSIDHENQIIDIAGNYDAVEWISGGSQVGSGSSIDASSLDGYVRAILWNGNVQAHTQPFLLTTTTSGPGPSTGDQFNSQGEPIPNSDAPFGAYNGDIPDANWTLEASDDFTGTLADSNWSASYGWGRTHSSAVEYTRDEDTWVDQDTNRLVIQTVYDTNAPDNWYSGAANTLRNVDDPAPSASNAPVSGTHGVWEASIRMPEPVDGFVPGFWCRGAEQGGNSAWPPEVDFVERFGWSGGTTASGNVHWNAGSGNQEDPIHDSPVGTLSDNFHVFSCHWTPNYCSFYVDGILLNDDGKTQTTSDAHGYTGQYLESQLHYAIFTQHVWPASWNGNDPDPSAAPFNTEMDWFRYWTID